MNKVQEVKNTKEKPRKERRPISPILSPEERFRAIANLIIDRILEEQSNGNLENLLISKKL